jgi:N6-L-threonylcarbamoyladenine synthase
MARILAIESTCDETAAAVVEDGYRVWSNVIASQVTMHAKYRGVVPELASRAHIEHILPVIRGALGGKDEGGRPKDEGDGGGLGVAAPPPASSFSLPPSSLPLDAIAVAHRPGLIGSLLIGVTAAKTLAWALGKPLIGVDHVHAHLYSVVLETNEQPPMPAVGLVCSGGHTALYHLTSWADVRLIGSTLDDAVGEAYDKVAAILGLPYPGGPAIDALAATGDPTAVRFPRSTMGHDSLDFSFSGLKTAVLYHVRGVPTKAGPRVRAPGPHPVADAPPPPAGQALADVCASFQAACVDVLIKKIRRAVDHTGARSVIVGGGVSANRGLRGALNLLPVPAFIPPLRYCTDNAAMSGGLAHIYWMQGKFDELSLDAATASRFVG